MPKQNQNRAVVVDTSSSPHALLQPVPLTAVELDEGFWVPRLRVNREVSLPQQHRCLQETGRVDNFRRAAGRTETLFQGYRFNDSDVYKWLEAASWSLAADPSPELAEMVAVLVAEVAAAQQPDGYLDTYFMFDRAVDRWTNLRDMHELYCAGHLIQAAVAHHRALGERQLLFVARRLADHICRLFGPEEGAERLKPSGHPEIEMALVELARETGERRYLEQAQRFLDARGQGLIGSRAYHQDAQPFREMERVTGHAVRMLYLNAGAADLYSETGEPALNEALERLWAHMTSRQMYISGGAGSRHDYESFGGDYELPNERAYAETCAAIASVMWNWRMLQLQGQARYADLMEWTLYNAVLPGVSLDGQSYFYTNPLADDGSTRRQAWFGCACCPPNLARLLASLPGYMYSVSAREDPADSALWVHLYDRGEARIPLPDGRVVDLQVHTRYPWAEGVVLEVQGEGEFGLYLRIPGWCEGMEEGLWLRVDGRPLEGPLAPGSYVKIQRDWEGGATLHLHLPMPVRRHACHPYVSENAGRVALSRGPLLYCLEAADNPELDLRDLVLPEAPDFMLETVRAWDELPLPGEMVTLRFSAKVEPPGEGWAGRLYRPVDQDWPAREHHSVEAVAVPYYAWANRTPGQMRVWLRGD